MRAWMQFVCTGAQIQRSMQWNKLKNLTEWASLIKKNPVWPTWKHVPCSKSSSFKRSSRLENCLTTVFHLTIPLSGAGSRIHTSGPWTGSHDHRSGESARSNLARPHGATLRKTCAKWRRHPGGKTGKHEVDMTINGWCSGLKDERKAGDLMEPP